MPEKPSAEEIIELFVNEMMYRGEMAGEMLFSVSPDLIDGLLEYGAEFVDDEPEPDEEDDPAEDDDPYGRKMAVMRRMRLSRPPVRRRG